MAFQGSLKELPLPDIIQLVSVSGKTGKFTLSRDHDRGYIYLKHGQMVHATVGDLVGEEAIYALAIWNQGEFQFGPGEEPDRQTITKSNTNLLMEAARRLDEWRVLSKKIPSIDYIPELQVREVFQPSMSHLEIYLTRMLDTGGPRPIVLGTPPPKADNEAIRRGMQVHADFFTELASDLSLDPEKAELAPACLRLKLWLLLQQMMRETAERLAVEFWPVSASAMTEEGYLRPEYWGEDATHANAAYGALMLDEYEKRLFALR